MKCPECDVLMKEVRTSSHYGIPIVIDQCGKCGGLWFDDYELYRTKHGAAHEIEQLLNKAKLQSLTISEKKNLNCPRDKTELKVLPETYFSGRVQIDTCGKCGGFWFNYGEFAALQDARTKKIKKTKATDEVIKSKKEFDKAISKQALAVMRLYNMMEVKRKKKRKLDNISTIGYIIWILLRILLKK